MTIKQLDQKIEDVKLSEQLLVSRFANMLEVEAEVLKEKKINDFDLCGDSKNATLKECLQGNKNENSR